MLSQSSRHLAYLAAAGSGGLLAGCLPVSGPRLCAMPDVFLAKIRPCAGRDDRWGALALAKPSFDRAWRSGGIDDRRHRRFFTPGLSKNGGTAPVPAAVMAPV